MSECPERAKLLFLMDDERIESDPVTMNYQDLKLLVALAQVDMDLESALVDAAKARRRGNQVALSTTMDRVLTLEVRRYDAIESLQKAGIL